MKEHGVRSRRSLPRRRVSSSSVRRARLKVLRRRKVGRNGDKTFRDLVHNFWALVIIELGIKHGLYPWKERIPVSHVLEEVRSPGDNSGETRSSRIQPQTRFIPRPAPTVMSTAMTFGRIPLSLSQLSLAAVLQCGQSFRWSIFPLAASETQGESAQPGQPSHEYRLCLRDRVICLRQSQEAILWNAVFPHPPASPEETAKRDLETLEWINDYFQLNVDLRELYRTWSERDPIFKGLQERFSGIRILRQDPWENLISYVISFRTLPPYDDNHAILSLHTPASFALPITIFHGSQRWLNRYAQTTLLPSSLSLHHQGPWSQNHITHSHPHHYWPLQK